MTDRGPVDRLIAQWRNFAAINARVKARRSDPLADPEKAIACEVAAKLYDTCADELEALVADAIAQDAKP